MNTAPKREHDPKRGQNPKSSGYMQTLSKRALTARLNSLLQEETAAAARRRDEEGGFRDSSRHAGHKALLLLL